MNRKFLQEVLDFDPPDLWFDGGDVLKMVRGASKGLNDPLMTPQPNPFEALHRARRDRLHPGRVVPKMDETIVLILSRAVECLRDVFSSLGRDWPLDNYTVHVTLHSEHDIADVAFCPKAEHFVNGIPFEVSVGGVFANGPGVRFLLEMSSLSLVDTIYMR